MNSYNENDKYAREVQRNAALDLYSDYWGVSKDNIREIDEEAAAGSELAQLIDSGNGVDKIIKLKGNLMLAQRIRTPDYDNPDFTIRRQMEYYWDAEYEKLRQAYQKYGTAPSMYAYGQGTEDKQDLIFMNIVDFRRFIDLEFSGELQKLKSKEYMEAGDEYYWENKGDNDNGFYAWDWDELRSHGLIEAEYSDGKLVRFTDRGNKNVDKQSFLADFERGKTT